MSAAATKTADDVLEPGVAEDAASPFTPFEDSAMEQILNTPEVQATGIKAAKDEPPAKVEEAAKVDESPTDEQPAKTEDEKTADEKAEESPAYQKRLDELTARRKTAEEKAEALQLRAEAAEAKAKALEAEEPIKLQGTDGNPLVEVFSADKLREKVQQAERDATWFAANPEGGIRRENGKTVEYSAADVADGMAKAQGIKSHALDRAIFITEFKAERERAKAAFPTLFDPESPDMARGKEILKEIPALATRPDLYMLVGKIIAGEKALTVKPKATPTVATGTLKVTPAKTAPKAPVAIESGSAPRTLPGKAQQRDSVGLARTALAAGNVQGITDVIGDFVDRLPLR
jgi:hypothetical protein